MVKEEPGVDDVKVDDLHDFDHDLLRIHRHQTVEEDSEHDHLERVECRPQHLNHVRKEEGQENVARSEAEKHDFCRSCNHLDGIVGGRTCLLLQLLLEGEVGLVFIHNAIRVHYKLLGEHFGEKLNLDPVFGVETLRDQLWNRKLQLHSHSLHLDNALRIILIDTVSRRCRLGRFCLG